MSTDPFEILTQTISTMTSMMTSKRNGTKSYPATPTNSSPTKSSSTKMPNRK